MSAATTVTLIGRGIFAAGDVELGSRTTEREREREREGEWERERHPFTSETSESYF